MCENVLCFDSHVLQTINAINYVPRFTVHVYGHVMSGILSEHTEVNMVN